MADGAGEEPPEVGHSYRLLHAPAVQEDSSASGGCPQQKRTDLPHSAQMFFSAAADAEAVLIPLCAYDRMLVVEQFQAVWYRDG